MNVIDKETTALLEQLGEDKPAPESSNFKQGISTSTTSGVTSSVEEKALSLLGAGVQAESVAAALGVTPARISQLLSNKLFADKVAELRYNNLQKHNQRDSKYDSLEDILLVKLEKSMPLLVKPESIMKAISIVNGAKRRGQSAPDQVVNQQNIVTLMMPTSIVQKFSVNIKNQVTKAGNQSLLTMQAGTLLKQVEQAAAMRHQPLEVIDDE